MTNELLEQIRAENLSVYRASQQRLREDIGQESQIAQDYRGRLIYELLQNADDAMSSNSDAADAISFLLDDDSLWVANSGRPLDEADVRGLCGISASSKSQKIGIRRASIGHKGMGFKSVLEISDSPEVYSTTFCFSFSPEKALNAVESLVQQQILAPVNRAPITRFPWAISDSSEIWKTFRELGMHTAFRFPIRRKISKEQRDGLATTLKSLPVTSLVFLKHLKRVEVIIKRGGEPFNSTWTVSRQRLLNDGLIEVAAFTEAGTYKVNLTSTSDFHESFLVAHDPDVSIGPNRGGARRVCVGWNRTNRGICRGKIEKQ